MSRHERSDQASDRKPWVETATLLSIFGLVVASGFNTISVIQSTRHEEQARDTAQTGLLTQLNAARTAAETAINASGAPQRQCRHGKLKLDAKSDAALREGLAYYNYLAWLFNSGDLTIPGARRFFAESMIGIWQVAERYLLDDQVVDQFPELDRFVVESERQGTHPYDFCGAGEVTAAAVRRGLREWR